MFIVFDPNSPALFSRHFVVLVQIALRHFPNFGRLLFGWLSSEGTRPKFSTSQKLPRWPSASQARQESVQLWQFLLRLKFGFAKLSAKRSYILRADGIRPYKSDGGWWLPIKTKCLCDGLQCGKIAQGCLDQISNPIFDKCIYIC